jgi:hypothetical protein
MALSSVHSTPNFASAFCGVRMAGMKEKRIPEEWIGRRVIVEVKGRRRGSYLVLGRLQEVTDEGVTIDRQSPERFTERIRSLPWQSVVDVRLPKQAFGGMTRSPPTRGGRRSPNISSWADVGAQTV